MPELLLRPWQQRALDAFHASKNPNFLAVATPGAGKTTFALVATASALHQLPGPVVIVAPTAHLKVQWASAAARVGLHVDPNWSPDEPFAPDMHGIVTTYQQVASSADQLTVHSRNGIVVLDEIHHAGDDRAWGEALTVAFAGAARRLGLSGTPFRSDTQAIPFVNYEFDECVPDIEYGYEHALADGVVRPVYFPRVNGDMEWVSPDGSHHHASFTDQLDRTLTAQRLRTALSADGEWLPSVLSRANQSLMRIRRDDPTAGGLAITIDTEHAAAVAKILRERCGVAPVVATSNDADASKKIAAFTSSSDPWIVAVRMVSEGVDIPRLRVGVFATTTTTELFFRQAVGRLVRVTPNTQGQRSIMFLPDDYRLRAHAMTIAEARRHQLVRNEEEEDNVGFDEPPITAASEPDQLSLFQVVASTATTESSEPEWFQTAPFPSGHSSGVPLLLSPPPTPNGAVPDPVDEAVSDAPARHVTKAQMRARNTDLVRLLVRQTGQGHKAINAELNKRTGIRRISDATVDQLAKRATVAEKWLASK